MRQDGSNQYDLHYDPLRHCLNVRKFQNGQETLLARVADYDMTPGVWVDMAFRVRDGKLLWYINGQPAAAVEDGTFASGMVMLCGCNVTMAPDDVRVGRPGSLVITGDEDPAELATDPPETSPARGCSSHLRSIAGLCILLAMTAAALWVKTVRRGKCA